MSDGGLSEPMPKRTQRTHPRVNQGNVFDYYKPPIAAQNAAGTAVHSCIDGYRFQDKNGVSHHICEALHNGKILSPNDANLVFNFKTEIVDGVVNACLYRNVDGRDIMPSVKTLITTLGMRDKLDAAAIETFVNTIIAAGKHAFNRVVEADRAQGRVAGRN